MLSRKCPDVSGLFYPQDRIELISSIRKLMLQAKILRDRNITLKKPPKALICPHAGYIYSGLTAAIAYSYLSYITEQIKCVVLIGPAHKIPFHGIATLDMDIYQTPIGNITINKDYIKKAEQLEFVTNLPLAFNDEHCLEVQLPFLQYCLSEFSICPLIVGNANYTKVAKLINDLWGKDETLFIVSSDLSHFLEYHAAKKFDQETSNAITNLNTKKLSYNSACGRTAIQGLIEVAKDKNLTITELDLRNSGDTAGDKISVVGYGSYHVC